MRPRIAILLLITTIAYSAAADQAQARTWRVALDGSGDTDNIHEAGLLAVSGDTISVAPGRYDALVPYQGETSIWYFSGAFQQDKDLTIIGDDRDTVIIGPQSYYDYGELHACIYWNNHSRLLISDVMLVNARYGVFAEAGNINIRNCRISGDRIGIYARPLVGTVRLLNVIVEIGRLPGKAPKDTAMFCSGQDSCLVSGSEFFNLNSVSIQYVDYTSICDTEFDRTGLGSIGGHVVAENCTANAGFYFEQGVSGGVILRNNSFSPSPEAWPNWNSLEANGNTTHVEAVGNVFVGGSYAAISLGHSAALTGSGNHILKLDAPYAVELRIYTERPTRTIDLRGNFWGTAEVDSIDAWIWDGHDDPNINGFVDYSPIESNPVPAEQQSIGGLKALFR